MSIADQGGPGPHHPPREAPVKVSSSAPRDPVMQVFPSGEIKPIAPKKKVEDKREKG